MKIEARRLRISDVVRLRGGEGEVVRREDFGNDVRAWFRGQEHDPRPTAVFDALQILEIQRPAALVESPNQCATLEPADEGNQAPSPGREPGAGARVQSRVGRPPDRPQQADRLRRIARTLGNTLGRSSGALRNRAHADPVIVGALMLAADEVEQGRLSYLARLTVGLQIDDLETALIHARHERRRQTRTRFAKREPDLTDIEFARYAIVVHEHRLHELVKEAEGKIDARSRRKLRALVEGKNVFQGLIGDDVDLVARVIDKIRGGRKEAHLSLNTRWVLTDLRAVRRLARLGIGDTPTLQAALREYLDCCGKAKRERPASKARPSAEVRPKHAVPSRPSRAPRPAVSRPIMATKLPLLEVLVPEGWSVRDTIVVAALLNGKPSWLAWQPATRRQRQKAEDEPWTAPEPPPSSADGREFDMDVELTRVLRQALDDAPPGTIFRGAGPWLGHLYPSDFGPRMSFDPPTGGQLDLDALGAACGRWLAEVEVRPNEVNKAWLKRATQRLAWAAEWIAAHGETVAPEPPADRPPTTSHPHREPEPDDFDDFNDWDDLAAWIRGREQLRDYLQHLHVRVHVDVEPPENEFAKYGVRMPREEDEWQQLAHEHATQQPVPSPTEQITTGVLQCVARAGSRALSTVTWGRVPVGGIINGLLGTLGVYVTVQGSEHPAVRVAGQSLQTLLHDPPPFNTRDILRGKS